jgi:uncharacterized membrane protein YhaH (DUF805 family)
MKGLAVGFQQSVRTCLSNYANFNGRASRAEFWWFFLFTVLVSFVLFIPLFIIIALVAAMGDSSTGAGIMAVFLVLWYIVMFAVTIALFIPLLAAGARRLHDWGQTAWLLLLYFVPCGNIALIVMWALDGTPGDNAYGPKPAQ